MKLSRLARTFVRQSHYVERLEQRLHLSITAGPAMPNGGGLQRSMVDTLTVTFSGGNVHTSLSGGDLVLWNRTTHAAINTSTAAVLYDDATNTATWTLTAPLPDGDYRATLKSMEIYASSGDPLDGDADGIGGDDAYSAFHGFAGDVDGDRDVDLDDIGAFRLSYPRAQGDAAFNDAFDFDFDGDVDLFDLFRMRRQVLRTLAQPGGNTSPASPAIQEPGQDGAQINSQDLHMQIQQAFSDPDVGQQRVRSDFEVWTRGATPQRVWAGLNQTAFDSLVHVHFGDGIFQGPQAGKTRLEPDTDYLLRVRQYDNSGDNGTASSNWAVRRFHTLAENVPTADGWVATQSNFRVEPVPLTFPTGEEQFRLPTNIAFVPVAIHQTAPTAPLFYGMELYGTLRVVTNDLKVHTYATGLLTYNPQGPISGVGENGSTGLAIDPASGDLYCSMLYDDPNDGTSTTYPKVTRFTSTDGGVTAVDTDANQAGTQGTDILKMFGESMRQSHIVSNVSFGPDGKLYVHVGDGFEASTGQDDFRFKGKILRMNKDGSAPADNPYYDPADRGSDGQPDAEDYWYVKGLRNPFGGAWRDADAASGRPAQHYTVENGPSRDRFTLMVRDRNYLYDGTDASMNNFNIAYSPTGTFENGAPDWNPSPAPVNITFVQNSAFGGSQFPATKLGHAFVAISGPTHSAGPGGASGKAIQEWVLNDDGTRRVNGAGEDPNPRNLIEYRGAGYQSVGALAAGPDGLYFSTLYPDDSPDGTVPGAQILRVVYTGQAGLVAPAAGVRALVEPATTIAFSTGPQAPEESIRAGVLDESSDRVLDADSPQFEI